MSSPLVEIAKQKKQEWLNFRQNLPSEREHWKNKVKELYTQIKQWLKPLEQEKLLHWQENPQKTTNGFEEIDVGNHLTVIFFNGQMIKFEPIGLDIVGAYGRIDMQFGLRKLMIILKEKESDWIFTERYGLEKTPTYDFNQDTFEQLVTEFIESFS